MTIRVSSKTYYRTTGRLKDNQGTTKKKSMESISRDYTARKKFAECSCTKEILLEKGLFVDHYDTFGNYCEGSGEPKGFWDC